MKSESKIEHEPFLGVADEKVGRRPVRGWLSLTSSNSFNVIFIVANVALLALNLSLLALNAMFFRQSSSIQPNFFDAVKEPYSPAQEYARYRIETLDMTATTANPYFGEPRPELDEAWEALTKPSTMLVSENDMRAMNKTSIALKDDHGYVGYYAVYHQLHCLKRIYQGNFPEYYVDFKYSEEHFQHCMEVLRQHLMCKPDLTVNTMRWEPNAPTLFVGETAWDRKCIDWNSFHAETLKYTIPSPLTSHILHENDEGNFGPY